MALAVLKELAAMPGTCAASAALVFGALKFSPTMDPTWYKSLKKPSWTPPNWVFPLMWTPLKLLQSGALALVLQAGGGKAAALAVPCAVFGSHLFLGTYWNVVFFGQHKMWPSVGWMAAFWLSTAGSIAAFAQLSHPAALMVAPTLAWVSVATKLNVDIVRLNTGGIKSHRI